MYDGNVAVKETEEKSVEVEESEEKSGVKLKKMV